MMSELTWSAITTSQAQSHNVSQILNCAMLYTAGLSIEALGKLNLGGPPC